MLTEALVKRGITDLLQWTHEKVRIFLGTTGMQNRSEVARCIMVRALAVATQAARDELLNQECGGDAELRAEVERLLMQQPSTPERASTAVPGTATEVTAQHETVLAFAGQIIGDRYQLREIIGEGGMGTVWVATQSTPVRRQVAIKLIKPGMDSQSLLTRFEAERQALALMDHANIAKIFDGGMTKQGRPFFAMEYVRGTTLTRYCDQMQLTVPDRIALFADVCLAVQHAHQKGIMHRDLKPSNILVHLQDGKPAPKIIDFGLAKAMGQQLTENTIFTSSGSLVGTPIYMSPEQADRRSVDVDTRTDIYSLGVILYELLTGSTPLEKKRVEVAALQEVMRLIQDEEPPRPSIRLSSSHDFSEVAAHRRVAPRELQKALAGDLDWIVMKALEKDRSRRYATASAFADDLKRYLGGEAVEAAPPSRWYLTRKFVRRNRSAVTAIAVVAATLLLGIFGTAAGLAWALVERDNALRAEQQMQQRADELKQVSKFQANMLAELRPSAAGEWLTSQLYQRIDVATQSMDLTEPQRAEQLQSFQRLWNGINATDLSRDFIDQTLLQPAIKAIDVEFKNQPLVDAALRQSLADLYRKLGLFEPSALLQEEALKTRIRELGTEHLETIASQASQGILLRMQGRLEEAETYYRETLRQRRTILGNDHVDTIDAIGNLGVLSYMLGNKPEAGVLYEEAFDRSRENLGPNHDYTIISANNLGMWLHEQGESKKAEELFLEAIRNADLESTTANPAVVTLNLSLASLLKETGRYEEARPLYEQAVAQSANLNGELHPQTLRARHELAYFHSAIGEHEEAVRVYREVVNDSIQKLTLGHRDTLQSMHNLASQLHDLEEWEEAEELCRQTLELRERVLGSDSQFTYETAANYGELLVDQLKFEQAEQHYRSWISKCESDFGPLDTNTLWFELDLASVLRYLGKRQQAESLCRDFLAKPLAQQPDTQTMIPFIQRELALNLCEENTANGLDDSAAFARKSLQGFSDVNDDSNSLGSAHVLATVLLAQGQIDQAQTLLENALLEFTEKVVADDSYRLKAVRTQAAIHLAKEEFAEALELLKELEPIARRVFIWRQSRELGRTLMGLGRSHSSLGDHALAEKNLLEAHALLKPFGGPQDSSILACVACIIDNYQQWQIADPDGGHDVAAERWRP